LREADENGIKGGVQSSRRIDPARNRDIHDFTRGYCVLMKDCPRRWTNDASIGSFKSAWF
jgi:hypothetical protein